MKKTIPRFLLAAAATGLSFLLLADESTYKMLGLAVFMATCLTYGVLGWISLPERQQQLRDGTAPGSAGHRCIVCASPIGEGRPTQRLCSKSNDARRTGSRCMRERR